MKALEISSLYGLLEKTSSIGIKGRTYRYDNDLILFCRRGDGITVSKGDDELCVITPRYNWIRSFVPSMIL